MRRFDYLALVALCSSLLAASCAADSVEPATTQGTAAAPNTSVAETATEGVVLGSILPFDAVIAVDPLDETVEAIMLLVSERVTSVSEPHLVVAENRIWENAALDCPAMSELPEEIPTEGLEVRVEVDGVIYHVRVAESGEVRMCAAVTEGVPVSLPLPPGAPPTTMGSPTG